MSITKPLKKEWFVILILLAPFVASAILWDRLPEEVPTHFNLQGEADDWGPKWINAIMLPGIGIGLYVLLLFLPLIDPKKKIDHMQKPISAIRIFTSIFIVGVYVFVMAASLGHEMNIRTYIQFGVGVLILIMGNYLNSIKPNYFIGIRTPWTLENPEVWKRTHRLGSKIWVIGGLCMMLIPFLPVLSGFEYLILILIAALAGVPLVYSYVIFKQLEGGNE